MLDQNSNYETMHGKKKKIIISFDLDYTLIDNTEGIVNSFHHATSVHDIPKIDDDLIKKMIGMPLNEIFSRSCNLDPSLLITSFREFYGNEGIYQVKMYPGIMEKLKELKTSFLLGVITSKRQDMAIKLLRYLNIDHFFDYIIGENEEIKSKLDLKLKNILYSAYSDHEFVIVGDHPKDKMLAEMFDCPFIGVLTGHHSADQLKRKNDKKYLILDGVANIDKFQVYSLFEN